MTNKKLNWLLNSRAYHKAKQLVSKLIESPEKLLNLAAVAQTTITTKFGDKFGDIKETTATVLRLIKLYAKGEYRDISLESIALIVASIVYLVMPIDVIPDFIIALGYTDDAALLAWTLRSVAEDIDRFIAWEAKQAEVEIAVIEDKRP